MSLQRATLHNGNLAAPLNLGDAGAAVTAYDGTVYYRDEAPVDANTKDGSLPAGSSIVLYGTQYFATAATVASIQAVALPSSVASPPAATPPSSTPISYSGFAIDNMPSASFRPYSAQSPFNTPVEASPTPAAQSASIMTSVIADCAGVFPSTLIQEPAPVNDYSHPIYYAKTTDPLMTITSSGSPSMNGQQLRVPSFAVAAAGSDGHMCVVQPSGWVFDMWQVATNFGAGTMTCTYGGRQRYDGMGIVTPQMRTDSLVMGVGATAPWFGLEAGIIRASELVTGVIDHALFVVVKKGSLDTTFGNGTVGPNGNGVGGAGSSVWPAIAGDSAASGVRPPMGARFQLNMTNAAIDATSAPGWEKTIAKACVKYGAYFGDTGGSGFAFMMESAIPYVAAGVTNPMAEVAARTSLTKDPTWGYGFVFYTGSNKIDWAGNLRVLTPLAH